MTTGGFDLGGLDMGALLAQAQSVQSQLEAAQNKLAESSFKGTAGGGLVCATVTGAGELDGLTIAPEALEDTDAETLADLVVAAVKDATEQARTMQRSLMPQVPGIGL
ncbi:YbaB/EbfC family nucleoid-associated protein [Cutibacterium sp.]|uniref:YbaB/EbfC family nucleoid-associated protein n=1 Tax=Cutibacterium sp. TaxID=1912221 RepID=UPI0026DABB19|nr:YbaB/EbfC family nucleoid-associated protein [Cutibacterium sp.]MDO4412704.1 YbaB/EbfC family nucleoid-associated protein [Cutibacterium sp.]